MKLGQTSFVGFVSQFSSSVIGFVATIYITRTLGASVFGEYMLVIAMVIWLQVLGVLGVESAVTKRLSEKGGSSKHIAAGALIVFTCFLLLSIAILVFGDRVNEYVGVDVALYIPALLLAGMAFTFVAATLRGQHQVHIAALLQPLDRTIRSSLQIIAVFLGSSIIGLLVGYVIAGLVVTVVGLYYVSTKYELPEWQHVREITSYAKYAWLGRLGSRAFSSMDTIVLGVFVSSSFIGYYEVAWNLASLLALFGVVIAQTLFPEISRVASEDDSDQVGELVADGLTYTGLFLIPGLIGSFLIGDLILRIYGNEFAHATTVLLILVTGRLVYEYGNQFLNGLNGLDRPDLAFRVNLVFIVTNIALNIGLIAVFGWVGAAVATALSAAVTTVLAYGLFTRTVAVELPLGEVLKQWTAAIGMGIVVYGGRVALPSRVLTGVILVGIGAWSYLILLMMLSKDFRATIRRNLPVEFQQNRLN